MALESEKPHFSTPAEELRTLRERVKAREEREKERGFAPESERITREEAERLVQKEEKMMMGKEGESEGIAEGLEPEAHDVQIEKLLHLVQEKGISAALAVLDKMDNPHLEDDFHRALAQLVKHGSAAALRSARGREWHALKMTLFEVSLPEEPESEGTEKPLKEALSRMEQFYAGMQSIGMEKGAEPGWYTIELALPASGEEIIMYAAVPDHSAELFEKQLLSIFPKADIREQKNDYNVFAEGGVSVGSVASLARKPVFPVKTYEQFDYDPLQVILNAFSNIQAHGEGAAIQLVIHPAGDVFVRKYQEALARIRKGVPVDEAADIPHTIWQILRKEFGAFVLGKRPARAGEQGEEELPRQDMVDQIVVENIERKAASPVAGANLRLVASAGTEERAKDILSHIEAAFNQFESTRGNKILFREITGFRLKKFLRSFSFRDYLPDALMPLSLRELTSFLHFPSGEVAAPRFKQAKAATAPLPAEAAKEGTLLGVNRHHGEETSVYFGKEDRLRHFYLLGQTGTGKTTLLKNMIAEDMRAGEGVCMIDPHGSDILDVLSLVPPERHEDVIYFDPSYTERVMALNMLQIDPAFPEQKTFVVNELFSIFQKLYGAVPESMGPMFEQYFRNAALLVLEDPESGSTLLDVARVLSDKPFRDQKLSRAKNPLLLQFWQDIAGRAGGEQALENIVPYITSKFDVFMANDYLRPIISQERSSFDFRKIMDERKILLVNLAKGRLGDINAHLLGLIIVGKILMAALSRVDAPEDSRPPFYLYIDEFQNITTDSITTILSEARKYRLSLAMAHQFIGQLEENIKNAVFGNVGSLAVFRVGYEDAEMLQGKFEPTVTAHDLVNLPNFSAYARLLSAGHPMKPFSLTVLPPEEGDKTQIEQLRDMSYEKYGRTREEVEEEVRNRYTSTNTNG